MGTSAPKPVVELVERFERNRKVFLSRDYKEEQLRVSSGPSLSIRHSSFVTRTSPHESLGWDMDCAIDTIQDRNWELSLFVPVPKLGFADTYAPEQRKAEAS